MQKKIGHAAPIQCRIGCGACCIAPSISSPIPGLPHGKPAGMRCVQLTDDNRCQLFGKPERPAVCQQFSPAHDVCGDSAAQAITLITQWEQDTTST